MAAVLKVLVLGAVATALLACSNVTGQPPANTPQSLNAATTPAADLRTRLDLLLGEHAILVAKETAAAVNHSDEYAGYAGLLVANSSDLTELMRRAFGNTTAAQLARNWNSQNGYLVDYAIAVVTHDDGKAKDAMTGLTTRFVPQFAQAAGDASRVPVDKLTQVATRQALEDKAFIDDVAAQNYAAFYKDLHIAYAQTAGLGDALALPIAAQFPDKFPGDPSARAVDLRVSLNMLLQEHSYLATMATSAVVARRTDEKSAAVAVLASNADSLATAFSAASGSGAGAQFDTVWKARNTALIAYASGDGAAGRSLTDSFPGVFASLAHVSRAQVASQLAATIKVIDEQEARSFQAVAGDDRAAATSMQPIADSVIQG